jgi:hypothetical protein
MFIIFDVLTILGMYNVDTPTIYLRAKFRSPISDDALIIFVKKKLGNIFAPQPLCHYFISQKYWAEISLSV